MKNFTAKEADEMKGIDLDQAQRDMVDAIAKNDFPKWALKIQVMTDEQAKRINEDLAVCLCGVTNWLTVRHELSANEEQRLAGQSK